MTKRKYKFILPKATPVPEIEDETRLPPKKRCIAKMKKTNLLENSSALLLKLYLENINFLEFIMKNSKLPNNKHDAKQRTNLC